MFIFNLSPRKWETLVINCNTTVVVPSQLDTVLDTPLDTLLGTSLDAPVFSLVLTQLSPSDHQSHHQFDESNFSFSIDGFDS